MGMLVSGLAPGSVCPVLPRAEAAGVCVCVCAGLGSGAAGAQPGERQSCAGEGDGSWREQLQGPGSPGAGAYSLGAWLILRRVAGSPGAGVSSWCLVSGLREVLCLALVCKWVSLGPN